MTAASSSSSPRPLVPGVWAPIPTFFDENEEVDVPTFAAHTVRLAQAGMYPVISGSMGEAHHLTPTERKLLITSARSALDSAGLNHVPIIAGTGLGSTKGTIELCKDAAEAGADFAIVIPSGYYAGALKREALKKFFVDVSEASPIPVMIYNYPGASGGLDMDSDLIIDIAKSGRNICGVKLTCGAVGKLTRITQGTTSESFLKQYPRKVESAPFLTLGGFADFMLPTILGGKAGGAIMGLGNVYPHSLSKLFKDSTSLLKSSAGDSSFLASTTALQGLASNADWAFMAPGIAGTKWYLQQTRGYGGVPRLPILPFTEEQGKALMADSKMEELMVLERKLEEEAGKKGSKVNGVNGH